MPLETSQNEFGTWKLATRCVFHWYKRLRKQNWKKKFWKFSRSKSIFQGFATIFAKIVNHAAETPKCIKTDTKSGSNLLRVSVSKASWHVPHENVWRSNEHIFSDFSLKSLTKPSQEVISQKYSFTCTNNVLRQVICHKYRVISLRFTFEPFAGASATYWHAKLDFSSKPHLLQCFHSTWLFMWETESKLFKIMENHVKTSLERSLG